jgi:predicted DNA-binding transcriptional regulator AlpA
MGASLATITHRIRTSDDPAFLSAAQVQLRYGVSDSWIFRHIRDHGMRPGVRLGGPTSARHWRIADLEAWERERERQS